MTLIAASGASNSIPFFILQLSKMCKAGTVSAREQLLYTKVCLDKRAYVTFYFLSHLEEGSRSFQTYRIKDSAPIFFFLTYTILLFIIYG